MEFTCDWYFSSLEKSPYRRINEILTYCSMMYPVSEENYWEEHGEEGFNLPTYMERKTRFIYMYMPYFWLLSLSLSINLSPGVNPEIESGWGVIGGWDEPYIHVHKEIKHVYRLHLFQLFSLLNFYLCLVSVILLVFLFQKGEWGGGGGGLWGYANEGPHFSQREPRTYNLFASYTCLCSWRKKLI